MAKITLPDIASQFASQEALNERFEEIARQLNDKVLYRDNPETEPNEMRNDLDMGLNDILNIRSLYIDGVDLAEAVRQPTAPDSEWGDGTNNPVTSLRFKQMDGEWGEWEDLRGYTGLTGADSTQAGTDGIDGIDGIDGTNGTNGSNGTNGIDSTVAGPQGPQGETGATGTGSITKYEETIGDGSQTIFTINHNLGEEFVAVDVFSSGASTATVDSVSLTDSNNAEIVFSSAPSLDGVLVGVIG